MDDHTIQTFEDAEAFLAARADMVPALLRDLLDPESLRPVVARIMRHHNLPESMRTALENEIALVLLAVEPYHNLHANIARSLALPPLTADAVAQDITLALLSPGVLEALDVLYAAQGRDDIPSATRARSAANAPHDRRDDRDTQETPERIVGYANMRRAPAEGRATTPETTPTPAREQQTYVVPPYQRPMTDDTPRYRDDPYRNPPR